MTGTPETPLFQSQMVTTLADSRGQIIDAVAAEIKNQLPVFDAHPDPGLDGELRTVVAQNFDAFMASVETGSGPGSKDLGFIKSMVGSGATRQIPRADAIRAFRIALQVLWEEILVAANRIGADPAATLELVLPAMLYIDAASTEVAETQMQVKQSLSANADYRRTELIESLIDGRLPTEQAIRELAGEITINDEIGYVVTVVRGADGASLTRLRSALDSAAQSRRTVSRIMRGELVAIQETSSRKFGNAVDKLLEVAYRASQGNESLSVGTGNLANGWLEIKSGYLEARAAAESAGPGGLIAISDLSLAEKMATMLPHGCSPERLIEPALRDKLIEDLSGAGTIAETVTAYSECDLNAKRAAERLYLHPNTVLYRLRRIREQLGIDIDKVPVLLDLVVSIKLVSIELRSSTDSFVASRP